MPSSSRKEVGSFTRDEKAPLVGQLKYQQPPPHLLSGCTMKSLNISEMSHSVGTGEVIVPMERRRSRSLNGDPEARAPFALDKFDTSLTGRDPTIMVESSTRKVLDRCHLGWLYRNGTLIKIIIFSLLCVIASLVYLIEDYEHPVSQFVSLTGDGSVATLEKFPHRAGMYWEVEITIKGLIDPKAEATNTTQMLRIDLCEHGDEISPECYGEELIAIARNSTETEEVTFRRRLMKNKQIYLNMQLFHSLDEKSYFSFELDYTLIPKAKVVQLSLAVAILALLYLLIITEIIHRTIAAMFVSTLSLAALSYIGKGPDVEHIVNWIEWDTLMLLFGMMILVAVFAESGFFDYLAVLAFRLSRGQTWPIIYILCFTTAIFSSCLDNVTTILLITPITINLCEILGMEPKWVLLAEVIMSNIGGTATAVGDPPNVLIVSAESLSERGINFGNFTMHLFPGAFLACLVGMVTIRLLYRNVELVTNEDLESRSHRRELNTWKQAISRSGNVTEDEKRVRRTLIDHFRRLVKSGFEISEKKTPNEAWAGKLHKLEANCQVDRVLLTKCSVVLTVVVILFFLQSSPLMQTSLGTIAVLGAIVLLILTDISDIEAILHKVEWSTLIFFSALFVIMQALHSLGLLDAFGELTTELIDTFPPDYHMFVAVVIIVWVSALASSFIDNIPFTEAMIPVIVSLDENNKNLTLQPLVYALAFGACLGGNGTLIGASANVVCSGIAESKGIKISFKDFFVVGFPVMLVTTAVATCYLLFCHTLLQWHE